MGFKFVIIGVFLTLLPLACSQKSPTAPSVITAQCGVVPKLSDSRAYPAPQIFNEASGKPTPTNVFHQNETVAIKGFVELPQGLWYGVMFVREDGQIFAPSFALNSDPCPKEIYDRIKLIDANKLLSFSTSHTVTVYVFTTGESPNANDPTFVGRLNRIQPSVGSFRVE